MVYGTQILLNPSTTYSGGMDSPDARTRGGVFGPQGYGGGIFDGSRALGRIGQEDEAYAWSEMIEPFPWMEYSLHTQSFQDGANDELSARGLPFIIEDGVLGPETCGAARHLFDQYGLSDFEPPSTCESFGTYPPRAAPSAEAAPSPEEAATTMQRAGMRRGFGLLAIGAIIAGLGVVAYTTSRRR